MKTRENFEWVRNSKSSKFNLRFRIMVTVASGMCVSILLGYALSFVFGKMLPFTDKIPLLLKLIVISIIVSLSVTVFVSRWIFEPLRQLSEAMEKVADGDFTVRITNKSTIKEIQEVYSGFNLMTHELASTEIIQNDFVSNVSHELKTPIAAIEGYSMLLQDCENLNEEQKEYVNKILFNTNRLSSLFGNMLLLSKLENQSIETNQKLYRLDEQIRESIVALEPSWVKKDIEFDVDLEIVKYLGNENLLRHVWDNLIGNAIKFSPQGGLVRIRLVKKIKKIIFTVEDKGPGITNEEKKHIFDKFYQADSSHKQEGHGLGLPLAKRIVMITGGKIEADNAKNGGCVFTVTLKE